MKALKYFASALALVALFTACEEPNSYVPAELPDTQEAYFPATTMTVSMEEVQTGFEVEIARVNYDEAATATLVCERPEGVNVPSSVSFNAGQEKTKFTVSVDQAAIGEGKTMKIVLKVDSESNSPYANQRCTVTLTTWSPVPPASWRPIETQALFVENSSVVASWFGIASGGSFPVYVEKLDGAEVYRIVNLYTTYTSEAGVTYEHPYWYYYYDESMLENPDELCYTIIDCEGYYLSESLMSYWEDGMAWMPLQSTNMSLDPASYGYVYWGTYAFNYAYPAGTNVGSYNPANKSITMPSGSILRSMTLYNGGDYYTSDANFVLFLDQNLAGTDFERDCAFSKLLDATYESEILDDKWAVALYEGVPSDEEKAAEYAEKFGQVIKVENAYVDGFNLYFCVNEEGKISVPEDYASQEMGISVAGFDLYLNVKKGQYADNAYSLLCEMVGVDPTGVKADVTYGEYTEVINAEVIGAASSIDEFVGEWVMAGQTFEYDSNNQPTGNLTAFELPVSMVKVDEETINMVGLIGGAFGPDYEDVVVWNYNGGYLQFTPQDMEDVESTSGDVFDVFATLCTADGGLWSTGAAGLIFFDAGISSAGNIKFFNDPVNAQYDIEADGFGIFGLLNGSPYFLIDPFFAPSMTPASEGARAEYVTKAKMVPAGAIVTELVRKQVEREYVINGQKAQKKSTGKVTPTFRPAGNFVELR